MTTDIDGQVHELVRQANVLGHGPSQVALLEEAARLADAHGRVDLGYSVRDQLMTAAEFSGYADKLLVAFSWCLGQSDRDPVRFPEGNLLWKYKWVISNADEFSQISRAQIEGLLEDAGRRFQRAGAGARALAKLRCVLAMSMDTRRQVRKYLRDWVRAPRDWLTDCSACECSRLSDVYGFLGEDARAVEEAAPILSGRLRCAEVPHVTLGHLLLPLVRLGRVEEAMRYHRRGYPMVSGNREFLVAASEHLVFLALTDNLSRAVTLFEKHLPWAMETAEENGRFRFAQAAIFLLDRLRESGRESLRLRLPVSFPAYREDGAYEVAELAGWFDRDRRDLAGRFDRRNGNRNYARRAGELRRLKSLVRPFPLRQPRKEQEHA